MQHTLFQGSHLSIFLDKKEEAQKIYEGIVSSYPDNSATVLAKIQLKNMGIEVKENNKSEQVAAKEELKLASNNYPNPFNPSTTISYTLPEDGKVSLKIFDVLGREVTMLVNQVASKGKHSVVWDGTNYASGIYFYSITFKGETINKKMLLVK